jgi:diacylglycerol kinase (ATP)
MWLLVVNPRAGKGKARSLTAQLEILLQTHNLHYDKIDNSSFIDTMSEFRSRIASGKFEKVIAIGGDGLINLCLQEIAGRKIALAVIPAGTGNDFARAVGAYKKTVSEIFDVVQNTDPSAIDLGLVNGVFGKRWYVQVLSTGFDALVNRLANNITWPKGQIKYTLATVLTLASFKPIKYKLNIDGQESEESLMLLAIANGNTYGGGMRICPDASNSDGIFDILLVRPVSKFVLITIFPKIFSGRHIPHPKIEIKKGKNVVLSAQALAFADGEFVSELPIQVTNVPKALHTWLM